MQDRPPEQGGDLDDARVAQKLRQVAAHASAFASSACPRLQQQDGRPSSPPAMHEGRLRRGVLEAARVQDLSPNSKVSLLRCVSANFAHLLEAHSGTDRLRRRGAELDLPPRTLAVQAPRRRLMISQIVVEKRT